MSKIRSMQISHESSPMFGSDNPPNEDKLQDPSPPRAYNPIRTNTNYMGTYILVALRNYYFNDKWHR